MEKVVKDSERRVNAGNFINGRGTTIKKIKSQEKKIAVHNGVQIPILCIAVRHGTDRRRMTVDLMVYK